MTFSLLLLRMRRIWQFPYYFLCLSRYFIVPLFVDSFPIFYVKFTSLLSTFLLTFWVLVSELDGQLHPLQKYVHTRTDNPSNKIEHLNTRIDYYRLFAYLQKRISQEAEILHTQIEHQENQTNCQNTFD